MNIWIKSMASLMLFSVICISLNAQKGIVVDRSGKKISSVSITSDSNGVLTVATGAGGRIKTKMSPSKYQYAQIAKPKEVAKAGVALKAKKYTEAAGIFKKVYSKYKFVGWGVYCAYWGAKAYEVAGKQRDAISCAELVTKPPANPQNMSYYFKLKRLLAENYAKTGNESKTLATLKILAQSNDDSIAAFSNNLRGDLLMKQGKQKDAKLMYMRTALLYDRDNKVERPEALKKVIQILKSEKNNKALEFEKMLKNDYP